MTSVPEGFPKLDKQTRPWACRYGRDDCTRTAPCRGCLNRRNRAKGMRKQREARKALERVTGAEAARFLGQLGNEEAWVGLPFRAEVKSGQQVGPMATRFLSCEAQARLNKAVGDARPFVMVAMPAGWGADGIFACRLSELGRIVEGLVNQ